jgi:hypothetical protein
MPNAPRLLIAFAAVAGIAACSKSGPQQNAQSNLTVLDNSTAAPNEVEALPADESSATPSNQLVDGDDSPDVNDTTEKNSD